MYNPDNTDLPQTEEQRYLVEAFTKEPALYTAIIIRNWLKSQINALDRYLYKLPWWKFLAIRDVRTQITVLNLMLTGVTKEINDEFPGRLVAFEAKLKQLRELNKIIGANIVEDNVLKIKKGEEITTGAAKDFGEEGEALRQAYLKNNPDGAFDPKYFDVLKEGRGPETEEEIAAHNQLVEDTKNYNAELEAKRIAALTPEQISRKTDVPATIDRVLKRIDIFKDQCIMESRNDPDKKIKPLDEKTLVRLNGWLTCLHEEVEIRAPGFHRDGEEGETVVVRWNPAELNGGNPIFLELKRGEPPYVKTLGNEAVVTSVEAFVEWFKARLAQ